MFFKKKKNHDHEYLEEEIASLLKLINDQKLELEKINSHIISLRGFVNRRMSGQDLPEETIKNTDGLDGLRFNKKSG